MSERLSRIFNRQLDEPYDTEPLTRIFEALEQIEQENKELRKALKEIASAQDKHIEALPQSHAWIMREIARRAIGGE